MVFDSVSLGKQRFVHDVEKKPQALFIGNQHNCSKHKCRWGLCEEHDCNGKFYEVEIKLDPEPTFIIKDKLDLELLLEMLQHVNDNWTEDAY